MSEIIEYKKLTIKEAKSLIRNRPAGTTFFASCSVNLPLGHTEGRVFPGYTNVKISKKEALRMVGDVLENFEERGGRINIRASKRCCFVG